MENLVVAEHRRAGVGTAAAIAHRPGGIQQAAGQHQPGGPAPAWIHTPGSARPAAQPSPANVAPTRSSGALIHLRWMAAAATASVHTTVSQASPNVPGMASSSTGVAVPGSGARPCTNQPPAGTAHARSAGMDSRNGSLTLSG